MGGKGAAGLGEAARVVGKNDASVGAGKHSISGTTFSGQLVSLPFNQGEVGMGTASVVCVGENACDPSPILLSLPNLSEKSFTSETFPLSPTFNFGS